MKKGDKVKMVATEEVRGQKLVAGLEGEVVKTPREGFAYITVRFGSLDGFEAALPSRWIETI